MLHEQHYAAELKRLKLFTEEVLMKCLPVKKRFTLPRKKELKYIS